MEVWGPRQTEGLGNHLTLVTLLATFPKVRFGAILSNCKWSAGSSLDLLCKSTLLLISAMVNYGLMFDVETNPGPPTYPCRNQVGLKSLFTSCTLHQRLHLRRSVLDAVSWVPSLVSSTAAPPPIPSRGSWGTQHTRLAGLPVISHHSPSPSRPSLTGITPGLGRRACWWCQSCPAPPKATPGRR